jgi:hypothetical protein
MNTATLPPNRDDYVFCRPADLLAQRLGNLDNVCADVFQSTDAD